MVTKRFLFIMSFFVGVVQPTTPLTIYKNAYKAYNKEFAHCSLIWGPLWAEHFAQNLYDFGNIADAMAVFNRQLFEYDETGVFFDYSMNTEHIGGNITPESAALLLTYAELVQQKKITPENEKLIAQELTRLIKKRTEEQKHKLSSQLRLIKASLSKDQKNFHPGEKKEAETLKARAEKRLMGLRYSASEGFANESLQLLNRAVTESIKGDKQIYPEFTAHKLILAYLEMSCFTNADLIEHSLAFDRYCRLYGLATPLVEGAAEKLKEVFKSKDDYYRLTNKQSDQSIDFTVATHVLENPEDAVFVALGTNYYQGSIPRLLEPAHDTNFGSIVESDHAETQLRNFFNLLLFDAKTHSYSISILEKLKAAGHAVSESLITFYSKNSLPENDEALHDEWAKVVSNLNDTHYAVSGVKLLPGVANMERAVKGLTGIQSFKELSTELKKIGIEFHCYPTRPLTKERDEKNSFNFHFTNGYAFKWNFYQGYSQIDIDKKFPPFGTLTAFLDQLNKNNQEPLQWFSVVGSHNARFSDTSAAGFFTRSKIPALVFLHSYFFCPLQEKYRLNLIKVILQDNFLRSLPEAQRMVFDFYHNHDSTYERQIIIGREIQQLDRKLFNAGVAQSKFTESESSYAALATILLEQPDWKEQAGRISQLLEKLKDNDLVIKLITKLNKKTEQRAIFKYWIAQALKALTDDAVIAQAINILNKPNEYPEEIVDALNKAISNTSSPLALKKLMDTNQENLVAFFPGISQALVACGSKINDYTNELAYKGALYLVVNNGQEIADMYHNPLEKCFKMLTANDLAQFKNYYSVTTNEQLTAMIDDIVTEKTMAKAAQESSQAGVLVAQR